MVVSWQGETCRVIWTHSSNMELVSTLVNVAERLGNKGRIKVVDMAPSFVASAPAGNREAASKVNI